MVHRPKRGLSRANGVSGGSGWDSPKRLGDAKSSEQTPRSAVGCYVPETGLLAGRSQCGDLPPAALPGFLA